VVQPRQINDTRTGDAPSSRQTSGLIRLSSAWPRSALAQANFHRIEIMDWPGINHPQLRALLSASEIRHSSIGRIAKGGGLIVVVYARGDVLRVADTVERELLDR
jgi:hypothetical protein